MSAERRLVGGLIAAVAAVALGVAAAWPIYETAWLWAVATGAVFVGAALLIGYALLRWSPLVLVAALLIAFTLTVVPVTMPQSLTSGVAELPRSLGDALAAVGLGWKQLLTLTLPVGSYRTVLVPAYVVFLLTVLVTGTIAFRAGRFAPLAGFVLVAPVAFGTVFGASAVSAPLRAGSLMAPAPRELVLWGAAALLGAAWVVWTAGAERRAALRRGRRAGETPVARGGLVRGVVAAATLLAATAAAIAVAPILDREDRDVPRDRIDPEIVVRERPSPLATYRVWKRDDLFEQPLFELSSSGGLPDRLRLAVLDEYDGVDFHIGSDAASRFTRFPSGDHVADRVEVTVEIAEGYDDIWAPTARLGDPPRFSGPRSSALTDAFYVNRETEAAIVVPEGEGLAEGDGYTASMSAAPAAGVSAEPAVDRPLVDLEQMPELAAWIEAQDVASGGEGLVELVDRLRARGYLSHSIVDEEGQRRWLERLSEEYGTRFESSAGGHSTARLERLFEQLNGQQRLAGENATDEMLVAGIGDDEQFATAAALIARALGYESRVVVGVRLGDDGAGVPGLPACESVCTGEHLSAWIEVRGADGAWAPIDTTPQPVIRPSLLEEGEQLPEFPTVPEERDAREVDPPLGLGDQNETENRDSDTLGPDWLLPLLRIAGLSAATILLLLLPLLFIPVAKRRRTKKRRSEPSAELRALGAWDEMVERARDAGVEVPAGSRRDAAAALGSRAAAWAAVQADRAVFSPQGITDDDADMMWAAAKADREQREQHLTRRQRLRRAYSLRSYGVDFGRWIGGRSRRSGESADNGFEPEN